MLRPALVSLVLVSCHSPAPPAPAATPRPVASRNDAPVLADAAPPPTAKPELDRKELGPACPKLPEGADVTLPNAEADIQKHEPSFSRCARDGRGGSTEVTWVVPAKGKVEMMSLPEPEPDEWCLLKAAERVSFRARAAKTVLVNAAVRLDPDGSVKLDITQAVQGNAVICEIVSRGGTAAGSDRALISLADSMTVCYRRAQRSDPSQTGGMRLSLELTDDGTVRDVKLDAERRSDLARDCVRSTAALARFPLPTGPASLEFSLRYVPE